MSVYIEQCDIGLELITLGLRGAIPGGRGGGGHCVNFVSDQQKCALKMCESANESYKANIFILLK